MKRVLAAATRLAESLGTAGVLGVALIAFSAAFAFTALVPLHAELVDARTQRERTLARLAAPPLAREQDPAAVAAQLQRFSRHFPSPDEARQELLKLQDYAARHGIRLRSGEYRAAADPASGLIRYQVLIPVRGSYSDLRAFIAQALEALPALALDSLSFKRDDARAREIEGRLTFTLYAVAP